MVCPKEKREHSSPIRSNEKFQKPITSFAKEIKHTYLLFKLLKMFSKLECQIATCLYHQCPGITFSSVAISFQQSIIEWTRLGIAITHNPDFLTR